MTINVDYLDFEHPERLAPWSRSQPLYGTNTTFEFRLATHSNTDFLRCKSRLSANDKSGGSSESFLDECHQYSAYECPLSISGNPTGSASYVEIARLINHSIDNTYLPHVFNATSDNYSWEQASIELAAHKARYLAYSSLKSSTTNTKVCGTQIQNRDRKMCKASQVRKPKICHVSRSGPIPQQSHQLSSRHGSNFVRVNRAKLEIRIRWMEKENRQLQDLITLKNKTTKVF